MKNARDELIKIAYENPELRRDLLRVIMAEEHSATLSKGIKNLWNRVTGQPSEEEKAARKKCQDALNGLYEKMPDMKKIQDILETYKTEYYEAFKIEDLQEKKKKIYTAESKARLAVGDLINLYFKAFSDFKQNFLGTVRSELKAHNAQLRNSLEEIVKNILIGNKINVGTWAGLGPEIYRDRLLSPNSELQKILKNNNDVLWQLNAAGLKHH